MVGDQHGLRLAQLGNLLKDVCSSAVGKDA